MQTPTKGAQTIPLLVKNGGLNDQDDSVLRRPDTFTTAQNLWDGAARWDADRRPGRDMESLDPSGNPVQVLFQFAWDDGAVFSINISGSTASYDAPEYDFPGFNSDLSTLVTDPTTPGDLPTFPNFLPPADNGDLIDLVPIMRELSRAQKVYNDTPYSFPFGLLYKVDMYDSSGNLVVSGSRDKTEILQGLQAGLKPRRVLEAYPYVYPDAVDVPLDYFWVDYFCRSPSIPINHLTELLTQYNIELLTYIKTRPIDGASDIELYQVSDFITTVPTKRNYRGLSDRLFQFVQQRLVYTIPA